MSRQYPKTGTVDVLFVAYGGGHIQMVVPVAQQLRAEGWRVSILALTTALNVVDSGDLDYFTFADLPAAQDAMAIQFGQDLAGDLAVSSVLPAGETMAYLGVNFHDLVAQHGRATADKIWQDTGRQGFFPIMTMRQMLGDIAPRLVVATNSPRCERAAIEAASALGIPAVALVDMFALHEVKWLAKPDFGDKLFVLDASVREMMIQSGRPADDVIVTGNPAFDGLLEPASIAAGQALRHERGWGQNGRKTLLYASNVEPELHPFTGAAGNIKLPAQVETHLRQIVADDPQLDLVIRRHPSEDQTVPLGARIFVSPRGDDINHLLHAVDVVVVMASTVGLQGYLAGRPVVSVQGSVFSEDAPFPDYGMAIGVAQPSGLKDAIELALQKVQPPKQSGQVLLARQRVATALAAMLSCQ